MYMINYQPCCVVVFALIVLSSATFKIGIIVDTDWIGEDLSSYAGVTAGPPSIEFTQHSVAGDNVMAVTNTVCKLLNQSYGGFISFVGCPSAHAVSLHSKARQIPQIMDEQKPCYLGQTEVYQLLPPCTELNRVVTNVVSRLKWLEVFIIHDEILLPMCLKNAVVQLSSIAVRSRILKTSGLSAHAIVAKTKAHNPSVIVVFVRDRRLKNILHEAKDQNLLVSPKAWIVITEDTTLPTISNFTITDSRILFIRQHNNKLKLDDNTCATKSPDNSSLIGDLVSDAKSVYLDAIQKVVAASPSFTFQSFDCRNQIGSVPGGEELMAGIGKVQLNGLSGILSWNTDKYPSEPQFQLCSSKHDLETMYHMGKWTSLKGLELENDVLFGNEFISFGARTLKITSVLAEPFVYVDKENDVTRYRGFCFDILNEMAKRFNFSYEIVPPPDGQYGGLKDDGTWSGMVGMVMRGEADFAVGPFTITSIRETVIDFTVPFMEEGIGILTKKITEEPNKIFKTLKPFTPLVWVAIAIIIVVVGTFLFMVNRLSPYTVDGEDIHLDTAEEQKNLKENLWLIYGSFLEQAVDPRPSSNSGRMMLGCWWVFTILMMSTYTANLAAFLTISITVQPINSLEELVAQDEIQPLVKAGTNLIELFKSAKSGIYGKVWEKMSGMPYVTSRAAAIELTKSGGYAFMTDVSQLEFVQLKDCESLALADEIFNQAGLGFVLPENAPFKQAFNLNIMKMQEAGMTERWRDRWWPKINTCSYASRTGGAKPLDMDSIAGLFYVYVAVVGISVVMFVLNLICHTCIVRKVRTYITPIKTQLLRKMSVKNAANTKMNKM